MDFVEFWLHSANELKFSPLENDHFAICREILCVVLYVAPMWWTRYGLQKRFWVKLLLQPLTTNINRLYYFITCPQPIALAPLLHRDGRSTMVTFVTEIFLWWFLRVSMESQQSHRILQFCPLIAWTTRGQNWQFTKTGNFTRHSNSPKLPSFHPITNHECVEKVPNKQRKLPPNIFRATSPQCAIHTMTIHHLQKDRCTITSHCPSCSHWIPVGVSKPLLIITKMSWHLASIVNFGAPHFLTVSFVWTKMRPIPLPSLFEIHHNDFPSWESNARKRVPRPLDPFQCCM